MDLPTADHARLMQYLFHNVADVLRQYRRKIQQPSVSKTLKRTLGKMPYQKLLLLRIVKIGNK